MSKVRLPPMEIRKSSSQRKISWLAAKCPSLSERRNPTRIKINGLMATIIAVAIIIKGKVMINIFSERKIEMTNLNRSLRGTPNADESLINISPNWKPKK